jgi:hypothetical protein
LLSRAENMWSVHAICVLSLCTWYIMRHVTCLVVPYQSKWHQWFPHVCAQDFFMRQVPREDFPASLPLNCPWCPRAYKQEGGLRHTVVIPGKETSQIIKRRRRRC